MRRREDGDPSSCCRRRPNLLVGGRGRNDAKVMLSEHRGDAVPKGLLYVRVAHLDEAAAAVGVPAEMQKWGIREAHAVDPAGNRVRIAQFDAG